LNTENSYLIDFEIYAGKSGIREMNPHYDATFGKPAAVFAEMVDRVKNPELKYIFFFDNLFTSSNLISHLQNKGYYGTGTIRANKVPKETGLPSTQIMKKEDRGKYYANISQDPISVIRWLDNSCVTVASNAYGIEPIGFFKRFSSKAKKVVSVKCPNSIKMYNKYMGG
jgi:hypothetical protein